MKDIYLNDYEEIMRAGNLYLEGCKAGKGDYETCIS